MTHLSGIEIIPQDRDSLQSLGGFFKLLIFKETSFKTLAGHKLK